MPQTSMVNTGHTATHLYDKVPDERDIGRLFLEARLHVLADGYHITFAEQVNHSVEYGFLQVELYQNIHFLMR